MRNCVGCHQLIRRLTIKNLGCFDEQEYIIDFSPQTLLAGPNNSGKSMFLTGINIVRQIVTGMFSWSTNMYNLVSFADCVHNHEDDRVISISLVTSDGATEQTLDCNINNSGHSITVNGASFAGPMGLIQRRPVPQIMQGPQGIQLRAREAPRLAGQIWYIRPYRSPIPYSSNVQPTSGPFQPLNSDGSNVTNYMLERFTDRDEKWDYAESWLRKIDPRMSKMKTPIRGNLVSFETMYGTVPINVSLQGSGFQSAATIIAALVFSPTGATIILEEPEAFLHPPSQEIIVDLMNEVVARENKQVIFSTHSTNILLPFFRDVSHHGARRGADRSSADPMKFSMWVFNNLEGRSSIRRYDMLNKTYPQFRTDFQWIWGDRL
jgi:hypothetical protein